MATTLAIAAIATSAIGAGVSYYGQRQASATSLRIADYNAQIQARNASMEARLGLAQSELNKRALEMQAAAQESAARVSFQNAEIQRADADTQAAMDRAEREKLRKDQLRFRASQRARVAGSGLTETGSPLAVLAETAGAMQLEIEEAAYASDLERRSRLREADLTEYAGRQGMFEAGITRFNTRFEDLKSAGIRAGYANAQAGIRLGVLGARANASAANTAAAAGLMSNLGNTASSAYLMYRNLPKARP